MADPLSSAWARLRAALTPRPAYVYMGGYGIATTWRGDRILLPAGDIGLPPYLATHGRWEPPVERLLDRLVRPGDTVVEAGANVGYHTLGLGRAVGPRGRLHAFEANPRLAPLLARTVEMAGLAGRVTLHACAVADRTGAVSFSVDPAWSAGGHLSWEGTGPAYSQTVEAPATRLDDALAELASVDLLRMDIEGSEGLALSGAQALVARSPRLKIVTEWDAGALAVRSDLGETVRRVAGWGFRARVIERRGGLTPVALDALARAAFPPCNLLFERG